MKYHVATITTRFAQEWQRDVFLQQLCDFGFDTIDGEEAYIPSSLWESNHKEIESLCATTDGVTLVRVEACPDENWNAVWEAEHQVEELPLGIRIIPHCAFGAGYHETTAMMIDALIETDLAGKKVLDHGTGTGVLAVFAKRLGAACVQAVDIDEKSVENAKENAELNGVEIDVRIGHTVPAGKYHLILANIHRNVLLANMDAYAAHLAEGGELWLSGFYEDDCPVLIESAQMHGLRHTATQARNEWRMIKLKKD